MWLDFRPPRKTHGLWFVIESAKYSGYGLLDADALVRRQPTPPLPLRLMWPCPGALRCCCPVPGGGGGGGHVRPVEFTIAAVWQRDHVPGAAPSVGDEQPTNVDDRGALRRRATACQPVPTEKASVEQFREILPTAKPHDERATVGGQHAAVGRCGVGNTAAVKVRKCQKR